MRTWPRVVCMLAMLAFAAADSAVAQQSALAWRPPPIALADAGPSPSPDIAQVGMPLQPALALAASAFAPGAGQYLLGQDRWVPYLVAEIWGWITYLDRRNEARGAERRYKDLAWFVARRVSVGERRDSVFDYYEVMAHFETSGAFDADPQTTGTQPELDVTTYNGSIWALARSIYIPGGGNFPPTTIEYGRALAYYRRNAIPSSFAWAWGGSALEQQVFTELIRQSDEAYRSATLVLGAIIANHVISAIDALVLARIAAGAGAQDDGPAMRLESGLTDGIGETRWVARLRLSW